MDNWATWPTSTSMEETNQGFRQCHFTTENQCQKLWKFDYIYFKFKIKYNFLIKIENSIVLTAGTKNTRNRLTRLILQSWAEYYLGLGTWFLSSMGTLGFSSRLVLLASPLGWCSWLLLSAGALGWCSRLVLSAGALGWCSRLVLSASPHNRWGVPASRSDAKVRKGLIFIR